MNEKYTVTVQTSLSQDGNSDFVIDEYTFDTEDEAKAFIKSKSNGWVHCYINEEYVK